MEIMGFQISDAVPQPDGSLVTNLVDASGNIVASVTRQSDGSAQASVAPLTSSSGSGFDWSNLLQQVLKILDDIAAAAQATGEHATRTSHAIRGAVSGAQAGYAAPLNWQPFAIGAAVIIAAAILANARSKAGHR